MDSFFQTSMGWASCPHVVWIAVLAFGLLALREIQFRKRYKQLAQHAPKLNSNDRGKKIPPNNRTDFSDEVEEVEATILFSDLAGFAQLSERLSPKEVVVFLNQYFSSVTDIILKHGGTVDKFIGDSVMAIWKASPKSDNGDRAHPAAATEAAIEIAADSAKFGQRAKALYGSTIRTRIGINTGKVVVGMIGSRAHLSVTAIGDQVNLASRLEGLNRHYGTDVLISDETAKRLPDDFSKRELDNVRVKGKNNSTRVFEPRCIRNPSERQKVDDLFHWYSKALEAYKNRQWDESLRHLEECLFLMPSDSPTHLLMERCRTFKSAPPGELWDGSISSEEN